MYCKSIEEEFKERGIDDTGKIKMLIKEELKRQPIHFGHPYLNISNNCWCYENSAKKYFD